MRDQLAEAEIRAETLEQQNRQLSGQSNRYWFMTGSAVLVVGILLGIWLPNLIFAGVTLLLIQRAQK